MLLLWSRRAAGDGVFHKEHEPFSETLSSKNGIKRDSSFTAGPQRRRQGLQVATRPSTRQPTNDPTHEGAHRHKPFLATRARDSRDSSLTSRRASPQALTAHSGGSIVATAGAASPKGSVFLQLEMGTPSFSSNEERMRSPRPKVVDDGAKSGANSATVQSSFSTRGLRVNEGTGVVNGINSFETHFAMVWGGYSVAWIRMGSVLPQDEGVAPLPLFIT